MKTKFLDGLLSLTRSLTNTRNASATNRIQSSRVDYEELRAIYKTGVGSKIIRLKSGIALDDTLQFDTIADKEFYDQRLQKHVKNLSKFMLSFGRAIFVVHESGADLSQPIKTIGDITKVNYHVFSGDMVYVQSVNFDLSSVNYFKPTMFSVRGASIHPSRVVDFKYVEPVEHDAPEYFYGGISEFELIRNELVADGVLQRAVPSILEKSSTPFYKVQGFKELLADNRESEVVSYFASVESLRSIYGAGIIDMEDDITTLTQSLSNLAESDNITLRRLAMVTGLPLSWLIGEAAKGLNSTGEGERQVLIQTIATLQSDYLLEPINRIMRLHGMGPVTFKDNQGETQSEKMDYQTKAIANAQILWAMGEDYGSYLKEHDVIKKDDFDSFFESVEGEEFDTQSSLEELFNESGD